MSHSSIQESKLARPGLRKEFRKIDHQIWLWTVGKQLTKCQIKNYAKEAFENAGIPEFKASDGWYRRWMARWGRSKNSLMKNAKTQKTDTTSIRLNNTPLEENIDSPPSTSKEPAKTLGPKDCIKPRGRRAAERPKSDDLSVSGRDPISAAHQIFNSQDLPETSGLTEPIANNPAVAVLPKKKIERYLPQFKAKVVSYALKYSIKDAVYNYKVNKSTIADWIRDEQKGAEVVDGALQVEIRPDHDFVDWLQRERKSGRLITKDLLLSKFKELTTYNNRDLATKKAMWFYKYMDRFNDEISQSKTHIMYPTSFKRELAKLCGKWSKKTIGRVFNVDRKRITNWVERYLKDNCAQIDRKVSCYLTDDKIDAELWKWYSCKSPKPKSKQIRDKAVKMYRQGGYNGINCSSGWYYRWRKRYMLPSSSLERKEFDDQLICWILAEFDDNKSITHAQLISQATAIKGDGFKLSPSWVVRFLKRYSPFMQKCPGVDVKLPSQLEPKVSEFRADLMSVINSHSIGLDSILAFDEVPLNFSTSGHQQPKCLLRKSGFENCHASLILVCTAAGELLPSTLILKSEHEDDWSDFIPHVNVAYQSQGVADVPLLKKWYSSLVQTLQKPHILICDSYSPHIELLDMSRESYDGACKLMVIPPGCSSRLLPTLYGINEEFKSAVASHWEKWLQETCWNTGNPVKLPSSCEIRNWVLQVQQKYSIELKETIRNGFSNILLET
uniref:Pogo transposable element with ZNF domain n=1 Tax=Lygus hesperus TaxID=30085 RepID=A0A146M589_LYGHE